MWTYLVNAWDCSGVTLWSLLLQLCSEPLWWLQDSKRGGFSTNKSKGEKWFGLGRKQGEAFLAWLCSVSPPTAWGNTLHGTRDKADWDHHDMGWSCQAEMSIFKALSNKRSVERPTSHWGTVGPEHYRLLVSVKEWFCFSHGILRLILPTLWETAALKKSNNISPAMLSTNSGHRKMAWSAKKYSWNCGWKNEMQLWPPSHSSPPLDSPWPKIVSVGPQNSLPQTDARCCHHKGSHWCSLLSHSSSLTCSPCGVGSDDTWPHEENTALRRDIHSSCDVWQSWILKAVFKTFKIGV